jgi:AmiR/NasT family two-component response regulator
MPPRIRAALERVGFQVCGEALGDQEAITKAKDLAPDLVVLDLTDSYKVIPKATGKVKGAIAVKHIAPFK